jgi:tocopherol cyclase
MAVVPGIFMGNTSDSLESHAFVFVTVDGEVQHYFRFNVDEFHYAQPDEDYYIQVGDNKFTHEGISLNLIPREGDDANLTLQGNLSFSDVSPWPVSLFNLGAMGPVGWMPFLECTHGVLSFDHVLHGALTLNGEEQSFDNGRGYTEKDHGSSFPSLWIWLQTNSFPKNPGTSVFVSMARIPTPFFGLEFPGFMAAVWHEKQLIPFATYTGAKFEALRIEPDELCIEMSGGGYRIELRVDRRVPHVMLYAPVNFTRMEPFVNEALHARVHMRLFKNGELLVDDVGEHAGLEVHKDVEYLVDNICGKPTANKLICL